MLLNKNSRLVWRWTMLCLLAFSALNLVTRWAPSAWQDLLDAVRGALLGATIGLMMVVGVMKRRGGGSGEAPSR